MVFATRWRGDRLLFYRHAPPPSPQDVFRDEVLPKEPFKGAPPYMRSVYYFWWAFLREHEGYRRYCETQEGVEFTRLFRDFGDVRVGEFMPWWNSKGRFTFCEPLERNVRVHKPDDGGRITDLRKPEEKIIISLPAHGDLHRILAEVQELIIRERPAIEAKASWSDAKYQVATKPVLSSLHQHLEIWLHRRRHPDKKLHELADLVGLQLGPTSNSKEERATVISHRLKEASCIIENVGKGQFPILRPSQLAPRKPKAGREGRKAS